MHPFRTIRVLVLAVTLALVAGLSAVPSAMGVVRLNVQPGPNGSLSSISQPDSNGVVYLGGDFSGFDQWNTGGLAVTSANMGVIDTSFPRVTGAIDTAVSDGSGGYYIGGTFTCIGPNTAGTCSDATDVARNRVAHILADGSVDATWNPNANGRVYALALLGSTVYMGGDFTTIGGTTRNRAAAVSTAGVLDASWNPNAGGAVKAITTLGSTIYIGGDFTTVGGSNRGRGAALTADGTLLSWNPDLNNGIWAMKAQSSLIYVTGWFDHVGADTRDHVAALDPVTAAPTAWAPVVNSNVWAIDFSADGGTVYIGGGFSSVNSTTRYHVAAVSASTGALTAWESGLAWNGSWGVRSLAVRGTTVYFGGDFEIVSGKTRFRSAAVDTSGNVLPWNPNVSGAPSVFLPTATSVFVGGGFADAGGIPRSRLAALDANGRLTDFNVPVYGFDLKRVEVYGTKVYVGGEISTVGGLPRNGLAAIGFDGVVSSWAPDPGIIDDFAIIGNTLYTHVYIYGLKAYNLTTGAVDASWTPSVPGGGVKKIAVSGSTIYVAGGLTQAAGNTGPTQTRAYAAAFDTSGNLLPWNPGIGTGVWWEGVTSLLATPTKVYLGGGFLSVGCASPGGSNCVNATTTRRRVAAVDSTTGVLDPNWNPDIAGANNTGQPLAMAISGSTVFVGGKFTNVNNGATTRNRVFAIGTDGTVAGSWDANAGGNVWAVQPVGSSVLLGGEFSTIGGQASRYLGKVSQSTGAVEAWYGSSYALEVNVRGTGSGAVGSSTSGTYVNCLVSCASALPAAQTVTLTATPAAGSSFTGWSGACSGTASTCSVTVASPTSVEATFDTGSGSGGGSGGGGSGGGSGGSGGSSGGDATGGGAAGGGSTSTGGNAAATPAQAETPRNVVRNVEPTKENRAIVSTIEVASAGTVRQIGTGVIVGGNGRTIEVCETVTKVTKTGDMVSTCKISAEARAIAATKQIRVTIVTTFTPKGGKPVKTKRTITLGPKNRPQTARVARR